MMATDLEDPHWL